jgi:hypothetical protein
MAPARAFDHEALMRRTPDWVHRKGIPPGLWAIPEAETLHTAFGASRIHGPPRLLPPHAPSSNEKGSNVALGVKKRRRGRGAAGSPSSPYTLPQNGLPSSMRP